MVLGLGWGLQGLGLGVEIGKWWTLVVHGGGWDRNGQGKRRYSGLSMAKNPVSLCLTDKLAGCVSPFPSRSIPSPTFHPNHAFEPSAHPFPALDHLTTPRQVNSFTASRGSLSIPPMLNFTGTMIYHIVGSVGLGQPRRSDSLAQSR